MLTFSRNDLVSIHFLGAFEAKRYTSQNSDWNDFVEPGCYWISSISLDNRPSNDYSLLFVTKNTLSGVSLFITQIAVKDSGDMISVRSKQGSVWKPWYKVELTQIL